MTTFRVILLTICAFLAGINLVANKWIAFAAAVTCALYWAVSLILNSKKNATDETKETLKNAGIRIEINGKEII